MLKIVERWFFMLDEKPIQLLMNLMKQPFEDLRFESLTILLDLSVQPWAQKQMTRQPGMIIVNSH